ncbi:hypothetical protein GCM10027589_44340 [Actinocorallia lasiicapitis]
MKRFGFLRNRAAVGAGLAAVCAITMAQPASAGWEPDAEDWGTVVPNAGCVQADAWVARVKGIGGSANSALFESHFPTLPTAPDHQGGGQDLINMTEAESGIGKGSALFTRAAGNKKPVDPGFAGTQLVDAPCGAYAEAGGASITVGLPYVPGPTVPLSPIGVHLEGIVVSANSQPGSPVHLEGGITGGYISSFGVKQVTIPKVWAANFGLRVPADHAVPAVALAVTNEQVTTDNKGVPTLDSHGKYFLDPTATSGYVNAAHATVLGLNAADATVGHAAVLRDPALTTQCAIPGNRCA